MPLLLTSLPSLPSRASRPPLNAGCRSSLPRSCLSRSLRQCRLHLLSVHVCHEAPSRLSCMTSPTTRVDRLAPLPRGVHPRREQGWVLVGSLGEGGTIPEKGNWEAEPEWEGVPPLKCGRIWAASIRPAQVDGCGGIEGQAAWGGPDMPIHHGPWEYLQNSPASALRHPEWERPPLKKSLGATQPSRWGRGWISWGRLFSGFGG